MEDQVIQMSETDFKKAVQDASKSAVQEALKTATPPLFQGAGGKDPRVKFVKDHGERQKQAECVRDYFKYLHENKSFQLQEKLVADYPQWVSKANFDSSGSTTGAAGIPTFLHTEVTEAYEQYGYVASLARTFQHSFKTEDLPNMAALTATMIGETTAGTEIDITSKLSKTSATVKLGEASIIGSRTWMEYANPSILDAVIRALGLGKAKIVDEQFFNGSGSGNNHTGLFQTSGINTVSLATTKTSVANITWTKLIDLVNATNLRVAANGCIVIGQTGFSYLMKEVDSNGRPIQDLIKPAEWAGQTGYGVLQSSTYFTHSGWKMVVVPDSCFPADAAAKTIACFGDFGSFGWVGNGKIDGMETFKEYMNSTALSGTQVGYKLLFDFSVTFPAPAAFSVLKTAAS